MKLVVLISIVLVSVQLFYLAETRLTSKNLGPHQWPKVYALCNGTMQSPINIPWTDHQYKSSLRHSIGFSRYRCKVCRVLFDMENTGTTLKVDVSDSDARLRLKNIGRFQLEELHFHWGSNEKQGSEHQLNGTSFPAELHFVHRNQRYRSVKRAMKRRNGLAVLAVFIKVGKTNAAFNNFLQYINHVKVYDEDYEFPAFPMKLLLPLNRRNFYRYHGSLTTPPCYENVIWTVFEKPIEISLDQLKAFQTLKAKDGRPLVDNFRPVQPLNGRFVERSFEDMDD